MVRGSGRKGALGDGGAKGILGVGVLGIRKRRAVWRWLRCVKGGGCGDGCEMVTGGVGEWRVPSWGEQGIRWVCEKDLTLWFLADCIRHTNV